MPPPFLPSRVQKRDAHKLATTTYVNEVVDAISGGGLPDYGQGDDGQPGQPWMIARVTNHGPNGEEDPTNEAYWLQLEYIPEGSDSPTDFADRGVPESDDNALKRSSCWQPIEQSGHRARMRVTVRTCWRWERRYLFGRRARTVRQDRHVISSTTPHPTIFNFRVTGSTQDGSNFRWSYAFAEVEKTGAGYGHWTTKTGGKTGTLYNRIEDANGASGLFGNGVSSANLTGSFAVKPIPTGTVVEANPVSVVGGSTEWWTSYENGIDGTCP